jgi:nitrogen fixation NifU-like protein
MCPSNPSNSSNLGNISSMEIYREEILDHAKNPRNWGKLKNPTNSIVFPNPVCGDVVEIYAKVVAGVVKDVRFKTNGCVVSVAASSLLMEKIVGMRKEEALAIGEGELLSWFGGTLTSSRRDCALLPLRALRQMLSSAKGT